MDRTINRLDLEQKIINLLQENDVTKHLLELIGA